MKWSSLKRNGQKIKSALKDQSGSLFCIKPLKTYVPVHYRDLGLVALSDTVTSFAVFALVDEQGNYAVSKALALYQTEPYSIGTVKGSDDMEYFEFSYQPGNRIMANTELVKSDSMVYHMFNDVVCKGRIPWYLNYEEDLPALFDTAQEHAGMNLKANHAILEMITAMQARWPENRKLFYRQKATANSPPPAIIGLKNVVLGATNTTAKLIGSYHNDATVSALVNTSERVEKVEELLRT